MDFNISIISYMGIRFLAQWVNLLDQPFYRKHVIGIFGPRHSPPNNDPDIPHFNTSLVEKVRKPKEQIGKVNIPTLFSC